MFLKLTKSGGRHYAQRVQSFRNEVSQLRQCTICTLCRLESGGDVDAALIHNHYPGLAAAIREAMGRGERASREAKNQEIMALRTRAHELNDEVKALRTDVARLASINEVLMAENTLFKAKVGASGTVISLSPTSRRSNS